MDKLTKFVCVDCEMTLLHFTEFCEMIKKTQQHLKASVASTKERKSVPNKNDKTLVSFYTIHFCCPKKRILTADSRDS